MTIILKIHKAMQRLYLWREAFFSLSSLRKGLKKTENVEQNVVLLLFLCTVSNNNNISIDTAKHFDRRGYFKRIQTGTFTHEYIIMDCHKQALEAEEDRSAETKTCHVDCFGNRNVLKLVFNKSRARSFHLQGQKTEKQQPNDWYEESGGREHQKQSGEYRKVCKVVCVLYVFSLN